MSDLISRDEVIKAINNMHKESESVLVYAALRNIEEIVKDLPSAQPEIIRCKDCAKREICRTSTTWAVAPKDDWYCADAERRTDE